LSVGSNKTLSLKRAASSRASCAELQPWRTKQVLVEG
jgi:hypothetical protein